MSASKRDLSATRRLPSDGGCGARQSAGQRTAHIHTNLNRKYSFPFYGTNIKGSGREVRGRGRGACCHGNSPNDVSIVSVSLQTVRRRHRLLSVAHPPTTSHIQRNTFYAILSHPCFSFDGVYERTTAEEIVCPAAVVK